MRQISKRQHQSGAVSLFIVIFTTLLITIVTVSFVQLMLKDQQQASTSDLSQSAYDSAQAGVEDAKRLLLLNQACENGTAASSVDCNRIRQSLTNEAGGSSSSCDTLARSGLVGQTGDETIIQQSTNDGASALDQAYTCVKVALNTDDYEGELSVDESALVPIRGTRAFDSVEVSWFSREDVSSTTNDPSVGFPSNNSTTPLPPKGDRWRFNYPSLMRTQLIQTGENFKLSDFDDSQGNRSAANTLFLYPSATGLTNKDFAIDARRSGTSRPEQIRCSESFNDREYVCSVTIRLPQPINGGAGNRGAYLRLTSLYNGAHFNLQLKNGSETVPFSGVQPEVDSTGRANDLFRRVVSRIELTGDFTYPEAALDLNGNLCKDFTVTDQDNGFIGSTSCTP